MRRFFKQNVRTKIVKFFFEECEYHILLLQWLIFSAGHNRVKVFMRSNFKLSTTIIPKCIFQSWNTWIKQKNWKIYHECTFISTMVSLCSARSKLQNYDILALYILETFQVHNFKLNEWYIFHSTYGHRFWDLFVFPSNAQLHNNKVMRVVSDILFDFY